MNTSELVLTYFPDGVYAARAEGVFADLAIRHRAVAAAEATQAVGYLAGFPGQSASSKPLLPPQLTEPMMVLVGLSRERMDALFASLRAAGAPPVDRKAILTPTNASWTFQALYDELGREHEAMHKKKR